MSGVEWCQWQASGAGAPRPPRVPLSRGDSLARGYSRERSPPPAHSFVVCRADTSLLAVSWQHVGEWSLVLLDITKGRRLCFSVPDRIVLLFPKNLRELLKSSRGNIYVYVI